MKAFIDTTTRTVTLSDEVRGEELVRTLDFLFPVFEWKKYNIRIDSGLIHRHKDKFVTAARVQINTLKHKGLHPWNEGYRLIKMTRGAINTKVVTSNKSKTSTNVLSHTRSNPQLPYNQYLVDIVNE